MAVGDWVLASALHQLEDWSRQGLHLRVSVNVSAGPVMEPGFIQRLERQLDAHSGIGPGRLELEILESTAVNDFEQVQQILEAGRALGVRFALDDFGTGYASLAYFRALPVDVLKIDQSFVRECSMMPVTCRSLRACSGCLRPSTGR